MEPATAIELFNKAPDHSVKFSVYTGEDDSTTEARIREKVTYEVGKKKKQWHYTYKKIPQNSPSWNLSRIGDQAKTARNGDFMCFSHTICFYCQRKLKKHVFSPKNGLTSYEVKSLHTPIVRPRVKVLSGVLQGTVLALLFFLMFVSDIGDYFSSKTNFIRWWNSPLQINNIWKWCENNAKWLG